MEWSEHSFKKCYEKWKHASYNEEKDIDTDRPWSTRYKFVLRFLEP